MNVTKLVFEAAVTNPDKRSLVVSKVTKGVPHYEAITFSELQKKINRLSFYFKKEGVKKGDKVLVFIKPGLDLAPCVFSLFKIGAVVILIDTGMGVKKLMRAVRDACPDYLVALPIVHYLSKIYFKSFTSVKKFFSFSHVFDFKTKKINLTNEDLEFENMHHNDLAAILFTSGGTGEPKGVLYTHSIFIEQTRILKETYKLTAHDIDMPGFPLFGLFTLSMGMTSVIPDMDPAKPSHAKGENFFKVIKEQKVTFTAGSPSIFKNLAHYCEEVDEKLPSLKFIVMFGAPVSYDLLQRLNRFLPTGDTYTPYGATECLPVTNIEGSLILSRFKDYTVKGYGVCVGRPLPHTKVVILNQDADGIGDIYVHSSTMTLGYFNDEEKTKESKKEIGGVLYHKMGDTGFIDRGGYLWFCGRCDHVVNLENSKLYPIKIEALFNKHKDILRSALINKDGKPAIVLERIDHKTKLTEKEKKIFMMELKKIGSSNQDLTQFEKFYLLRDFPTDIRHNIKIDRKKISTLVKEELK